MINFFKNIFKYRRFLWTNHWWDSHYIFYMLREKLIVDVEYYKKYGCHLHAQNDIDEMEFCIKLLNRIIKDEYISNALMPYNKKYPDWRDLIEYNADKRMQGQRLFHRCCKRSDRQEKQDVDYLFKYLSKHITSWWD